MAFPRMNDEELSDQALDVFRNYGYEGASLSLLAESAGLEKASLYYRYPGGKKDIALAVAARVSAWFEENVVKPLKGPGAPQQRVRRVAQKLRKFYGDGSRPCVLETLSLRGGPPELQAALAAALQSWIAAFTSIGLESGFSRTQAARRARQAIVNIEGSLVLSRVSGDPGIFLQALAGLTSLLSKP
jgi:TetR/AcrR family transcriptional regulator, lmrAB and yxaGH operons repressor